MSENEKGSGDLSPRQQINRHLWNFHGHTKVGGSTLVRFVFHEKLHAEGVDGVAGNPKHAHTSETDLNEIEIKE